MTRSKPFTFLAGAAVIPLAALAVAGCGGGNNNNNGSATAATPKTTTGRAATIGFENNSKLGKILVDSQGRTVYLFRKDSGTKSACSGACAVAWPPVRANGKPTVGSGLTSSKVGTTARSDGKPQVTYNGHPLYRFQNDTNPGDANGQGLTAFGGSWFVLSPAGNQVSGQAASSGGGSSNGY
jgi:predicted lipoprotein with Yx(FWY)xxD motif